ncbi:band 3 anion exchange protein isoform X2 [Planococcus citri]|uniref:band 3 anion exchange protein isoform X2 n=1 Tax=Planococcus citri TaxID=170843 RepID=UPI0031F8161D
MSRMTKRFLSKARNKNGKDVSTTSGNLDEEMEKVFAMSGNDKFDLSHFAGDEEPEQKSHRRYSEGEFSNAHRKRSYPHIHLPIKGLKSHSSRKSNPSNVPRDVNVANANQDIVDGKSTNEPPHEKVLPRNDEDRKEFLFYDDEEDDNEEDSSSCKEAALSERAAARSGAHVSESPDKRVQFDIESPPSETEHHQSCPDESYKNTTNISEPEPLRKAKRKHSHHKRSRKHSDASKPRSKKLASDETENNPLELILQLEEPLQEFVQDDLASHRFDFSRRDKRRFSAKSTISSLLNRRPTESSIISSLPLKIYKKHFDHSPHEVFVQLDELIGAGEEREWKETARWIKYEEDVEEGADRWGRPHVASLSFHSLLNLRRCLETGVVLLDLEEKELPGVAYRVVEQMAIDQLIKEDEKATVIRALLLRHRHVNYHERFRFMRRNTSSYTSLQNLHEDQKGKGSKQNAAQDGNCTKNYAFNADGSVKGATTIDMKEETCYSSSVEDLARKAQKDKESILKRIPAGAEATTVLVGTVDFLQEAAIAFVRLAEGIYLPAVTEVTIPVRFMFILLGPPKADIDYHEVGRSISTLMSNADFHKKAYKATDRRDLLRAINEFLDYSIVLPPGNWERDALLSLRELSAKNEAIRKRRNRSNTVLFGKDDSKKEGQRLFDEDGAGSGDDDRDDPLRRTNTPFGGLINDIKRRAPFYKSDFLQGINGQCLSAAIFMYFAALSAAITFGGLFAGKTKNMIGISETLLSTCVAGVIFGFMAGQPLVIIGTTGPLLMFDESLFKFCIENRIDYLTMRMYIGFWLFVIAILVASVEGSVFIKVFTRFTEEIFSSLISLLYIYESISNLISVFKRNPLMRLDDYCSLTEPVVAALVMNDTQLLNNITTNDTNMADPSPIPDHGPVKMNVIPLNQPNTALFCMILCLGTFFLAYYLRHFRNSKFLGRSVRRALGDFGVPIAIVTMVTLDYVVPQTDTYKLTVPTGLTPTIDRSWLVSPLGSDGEFPIWAMFAAVVPAVLVYILVFMETHISELIIGKKERKLKKGNGFHLDIVLVCFTNVACGMIGAPWMCAASVRSITHVSAVTVMSTTHAPGDKPHIIEVKEQRVSALVVSTLTGLSVIMAPYLRLVPMAVLFGVFLYMGVSSIGGVQFFERLKLFLMPVKHHPQTAYVRKVPTVKMYLFTLIQLMCLAVLWIIKSSALSLTFPFFLILMVPLRAQLSMIFTSSELRALDSDEPDAIDKEDDEPDFYAESLLPG